jgi:hypothetical protein
VQPDGRDRDLPRPAEQDGAEATGTDEGALVDCVETIAEQLTKDAVPYMRTDFAGRNP